MKRSLPNDASTPPPPFPWGELLPEMQGEVSMRLDTGTRECLAMTSKDAFVKWHNKQLENYFKRVKLLARDAPLNYLEHFMRVFRRKNSTRPMNETERLADISQASIPEVFLKGIVQGARLFETYGTTTIGQYLLNNLRGFWVVRKFKRIVIQYGTVDDSKFLNSFEFRIRFRSLDSESTENLSIALACGNIPVVLNITNDPDDGSGMQRFLEDSGNTIKMIPYFVKFLLRKKESKYSVKWDLLFAHPTWKKWLDHYNRSIEYHRLFASMSIESLCIGDGHERYSFLRDNLALFKFVKPIAANIDRKRHMLFSEFHYKHSVNTEDVELLYELERLGFEHPDVDSNWLSFDLICEKIVKNPTDPILTWLATNGYLTVNARHLAIRNVAVMDPHREFDDVVVRLLESFRKPVIRWRHNYTILVDWFNQQASVETRAIAELILAVVTEPNV